MSRIVHAAEALVCMAMLTSLVSNDLVAMAACVAALGVAVVVAPSKAESAGTREGDGR